MPKNGYKQSSNHKRKISKSKLGKKLGPQTEDHRRKRSKSMEGKTTGKRGPQTEDHKRKRSESMRKENRGPQSSEHKKKERLSAIRRLEKTVMNGGQLTPGYNPEGCKIIDKYGEENGYSFQHAENGGEFYIEELGYWLDGYDKEKNVVIEIDELAHFDFDDKLKTKDIERQEEIENFLGCNFIRIRI